MKTTFEHEAVSHEEVSRSAGRERDTLSYVIGVGSVLVAAYLAYIELFLKHAH